VPAAADTCQRLIDAVNARDWAAAGAMVDAETKVSDHRDLPFTGTGADMLGVWRATFDANADARAHLDLLDADDDRALARMRFGDPEGELAVHVVAQVAGGRITTFDAYDRGPGGRSDARAHFADR
jgi:SnoaL-like domain